MAVLAIPLEALVLEAVATVVGPVASHMRRVLLPALAVAVVAIAVGPLAVETGHLDRLIPSQTSAVLAAVGSAPHHLRVRDTEGPLLPVFLLLPTTVEEEAQALPLMVEEVVVALAQVGVATMVLMQAILHSRGSVV
jgi:hypothetical protein